MKVGSIVEEARNRSGKLREEERREAEEKVIWIFQKKFLNICSLRWEGTPSLWSRGRGGS